MHRLLSLVVFSAVLFCILSLCVASSPERRLDQFLILPKSGIPTTRLSSLHALHGCKVLRTFDHIHGLQVIQVPSGRDLDDLLTAYNASGLVEFAEPDYLGHTFTSPNDPSFLNGTLWALNNFGQSGGTPRADINATNAWDLLTSASNIVVAVLDTGIRYTHEDLAANMWINPNDGSHGTNAVAGTTDPNDDGTHGTPVAGIIGAVGNNGKGVTGVAWRVKLMACKCFPASGQNGNVSDAIACFDYARANGAQVINASFGFFASQALSNAVSAARDAGIIVVAACGNSSTNIDPDPPYPAGIRLDNVISVAYTTRNDVLASASNYGLTNVHLAAPGDQIYSTFPAFDASYLAQSGTSFAAPYVAGACALVKARFPDETHQQIIARILNGTDPLPSLTGKCVTGGRLNLRKALSLPVTLATLSATNNAFLFRVFAGPNRTFTIQSSADLLNWVPISTNTTSGSGTYDFTDSTTPASHFYRAISTP